MLVSQTIFLSANEADAQWLDALCRHLAPYRAHGLLTWDARDIPAGERPLPATEAALASAQLVVLLVSPYFIAEEFADDSPTAALLTSAAGRGLRTLWIPISASAYEVTALRDLQPLFDPTRPLDGLSPSDQAHALVEVCAHIRQALRPDHANSPAELAGQPYRLIRELRVGGLSTVWLAEETLTKAQVAVKVLHPQYVKDSEIRRRFLRGAKDAMGLTHPSIVKILDPHGETSDRLYYVMQFIDGPSLHDAVLAGKLPPAQGIPAVIAVGAALTYAHHQGTVHRDVHPGNILLDSAGRPYLADFDLVRSLKIDYAAPELRDDADESDPRVDVYGLGMTAVFVLHGKDFDREAAADVLQVIDTLPGSAALRGVLRRAISRRRDDRHATVAAFCDELTAAWSGRELGPPAPAVAPVPAVATPQIVTGETSVRVVENLAGAGRHVVRYVMITILGVVVTIAVAVLLYVKMQQGKPAAEPDKPIAVATPTPAQIPAPVPPPIVVAPPVPAAVVVGSCPPGMQVIAGGAVEPGVTLTPYCMDITEVTTAAYQACVASRGCTPATTTSEDRSCNAGKPDHEQHPINCVDWQQATAYCAAVGKRLPAEAEWAWVAMGREEQRLYPWGPAETDCDHAAYTPDPRTPACGKGGTWPVGSKPAGDSRDGLKDLAGNVWEWTDGQDGQDRIHRGGGWNEDAYPIPHFVRAAEPGTARSPWGGFRCAKALDPA